MGVKIESEDSVTGVGYYRTSVYGARGLLDRLVETDMLQESEPVHSGYDDAEIFKITITVEKL
jgi:hypothetical protein